MVKNLKMTILLIILGVIIIAFIAVQLFALSSQRNIEVYPYVVSKKFENFEIRIYQATLFTSVKLSTKGYKNSSSKGFSILGGYIFGNNERNEKIAMTSPVAMKLVDSVTMMFMVPSKLKMDSLPKPAQSQIEFKQEPAKTVAAIRFKGWANDDKIKRMRQSQISTEESDYARRIQDLDIAVERADVTAQLIAYGVIKIEEI